MTKKVNRTQTRSAISRTKITMTGQDTVSAISNTETQQNEESEASDELCNVNEDEDQIIQQQIAKKGQKKKQQ